MWKKNLIVLIALLFLQQGHTQLNRYKYIVVPVQFEGFKKANQFRTSTLIKHLFTREGFDAVYEDKIPAEMASKPCLGLKVRLVDNSSLFQTKVKLALQDCYGQVVFETPEGKSKEKDYELAYREAIEGAFTILEGIEYSYRPREGETGEETVSSPAEPEVSNGPPPPAEPSPVEVTTREVPAVENKAMGTPAAEAPELWYAQPTPNGYQLVDSSPRVRMKLISTAQENTFIAMVDEAPKGMVYLKDGQWWHEYYEDGQARIQELRIKF